jgi:hypothetical protein
MSTKNLSSSSPPFAGPPRLVFPSAAPAPQQIVDGPRQTLDLDVNKAWVVGGLCMITSFIVLSKPPKYRCLFLDFPAVDPRPRRRGDRRHAGAPCDGGGARLRLDVRSGDHRRRRGGRPAPGVDPRRRRLLERHAGRPRIWFPPRSNYTAPGKCPRCSHRWNEPDRAERHAGVSSGVGFDPR